MKPDDSIDRPAWTDGPAEETVEERLRELKPHPVSFDAAAIQHRALESERSREGPNRAEGLPAVAALHGGAPLAVFASGAITGAVVTWVVLAGLVTAPPDGRPKRGTPAATGRTSAGKTADRASGRLPKPSDRPIPAGPSNARAARLVTFQEPWFPLPGRTLTAGYLVLRWPPPVPNDPTVDEGQLDSPEGKFPQVPNLDDPPPRMILPAPADRKSLFEEVLREL